MSPYTFRLADPDADAPAVAAIYRAAVENGVASFEADAPPPAAMSARMHGILERLPWMVAVDGATERVVGYAYAGPHHERAGYRWSVDISVYVDPAHHGRGIARALYAELLAIVRRQGFVNAYAGVALPNAASVALHEAIGMSLVGVYRGVGYKFGAWRDVAWYGMRLTDPPDPPGEPVPLPLLMDAARPLG